MQNKKFDEKKLIEAAQQAREFAHARYSNFRVGAALLSKDGRIITGSNVESSSYGLTICAERVALTKALSEGIEEFTAIAIVARDGAFTPPCGACRQLLFDYAPDIEVLLTDGKAFQKFKLKDLLPHAFDESNLGEK